MVTSASLSEITKEALLKELQKRDGRYSNQCETERLYQLSAHVAQFISQAQTFLKRHEQATRDGDWALIRADLGGPVQTFIQASQRILELV